jgi:RNA methyltransferase, TrmH family
MQKITSRDNQKIKFAKKARDGRAREFIFIEGLRLAEEALRSNLKISDVFISQNFSTSERGRAFLQNVRNFNLYEIPEQIFDSLSDTKHSQGIILISNKPETGKAVVENYLRKKMSRPPLLVLLHKINNPSNLGAILRTCEAAGVSGVILTKNSADVFSPKALRGAMGASFRLPIWNNADYFEVLDWAEEKGLISVCADINSEMSYTEIDWKTPRLLIFGSEAQGLSEQEREKVNQSLIVPMENAVESLNLAVACGVILFEAKRQSEN